MKRFPITSIIKYLFIILIIGFFIILLLPEEKKATKIEEKSESTETAGKEYIENKLQSNSIEKNFKKEIPSCVAKPPSGHVIVKFFKYPSYLKESKKCRQLNKSRLSGPIPLTRPEKNEDINNDN